MVSQPRGIEVQEEVVSKREDAIRGDFGLPKTPIIFFFCRAAAPVARRNGATIVLVGDGPDLPKVNEYFSHKEGVSVIFCGFLTSNLSSS